MPTRLKKVTISLPPEFMEPIELDAAKLTISVSEWIKRAVVLAMKKQGIAVEEKYRPKNKPGPRPKRGPMARWDPLDT